MGRRVRIEFEEVAGYPQRDTIRLWIDDEEIITEVEKGFVIAEYAKHLR